MKNSRIITFNKIWIIESLDKGKTGTKLEEDLSDYMFNTPEKYQDLHIEIKKPNTKQEFLNVLNEILTETKQGKSFPVLHFECHGSNHGLETADKKSITWLELKIILREINRACRFNLLIIVAACKGLHLIKTSSQLDGISPFYGVIGASNNLEAKNVQNDFYDFYIEFFKEFNLDSAIKKLKSQNPSYNYSSAENLFIKSYQDHHKNMFLGKRKNKHIENLVSSVLEDKILKIQLELKYKDAAENIVKFVRNHIKNVFKNDAEKFFYSIKNRYFSINEFPENEDRFPFSYQDVIKKIN